MDADTLTLLINLAGKHQWVAIASIVIGFLVRLSKTSRALRVPLLGPLLAKIPPKKRPYVAILLGQVSAVLDHVTMGTLWRDALIGGVVAASLAVLGHDTGIEGARNGREVGNGKTKTPPVVLGALCYLVLSFAGCGAGSKACAIVDLAEQGCTVLRYLEPGGDGGVVSVPVTPEEVLSFGRAVSLKRDAGACDGCGGLR